MKISKNLYHGDDVMTFEISNWDDIPRAFGVAIRRNDGKPDAAFKPFVETELTPPTIAKFVPNLKILAWEHGQKIDKQSSTAKDETYTVTLYCPPKEQWWELDAVEKLFIQIVTGS